MKQSDNTIINHLKSNCYCEWSENVPKKYLILHDIKFDVYNTKEIFNKYGISSHMYISSEGVKYEFVPLSKQAYHAGKSWFASDAKLNSISFSIETQSDWHYKMPSVQFWSMAKCIDQIEDRNGISLKILSHAEIAPIRGDKPGKTDPGINFPWKELSNIGIGGMYPDVKLHDKPAVLMKFGDANNKVLSVQKVLHQHGYSVIPINGKFDIKTAAVIQSIYLRFYPQWFSKNAPAIKQTLNSPDIKDTLNINDQWLFNSLNHIQTITIDEDSIAIMEQIFGHKFYFNNNPILYFKDLFMGMLNGFNNKVDWYLKYILGINQYEELQNMAYKYNIDLKVTDQETARKTFRKIALNTHTDKMPSEHTNEDFVRAEMLSNPKYSTQLDVKLYSNTMSVLNTVDTNIKAVRCVLGMIKTTRKSDIQSTAKTTVDCMYTMEGIIKKNLGVQYIAPISIVYSLYQEQYIDALKSSMIFAGHILPTVLFPVAPAAAVLVKTGFVISDFCITAQDTYQEVSDLLYKEDIEMLV